VTELRTGGLNWVRGVYGISGIAKEQMISDDVLQACSGGKGSNLHSMLRVEAT
jgi:hypothetical protein